MVNDRDLSEMLRERAAGIAAPAADQRHRFVGAAEHGRDGLSLRHGAGDAGEIVVLKEWIRDPPAPVV